MTEGPTPSVPRETQAKLREFVVALTRESTRQNLVSRSTMDDLWIRHIADSIQLLRLADAPRSWLDIGSGAGFPGLVIAIVAPAIHVTLVEPRTLRAAFLGRMVEQLGLAATVTVTPLRAERLAAPPFEIVSARAVASIERLFAMSVHLADADTRWLLPKGRRASEELEAARKTWQGDFRLVPSLTDPDAAILVATGVKRRTKR